MSDHPNTHISHDGLLLLIRGTVKITQFCWISYSTTLKGSWQSWPGRLIVIFPASKPLITKTAKHHGSTHFRRRTSNSSRAFCRPYPLTLKSNYSTPMKNYSTPMKQTPPHSSFSG